MALASVSELGFRSLLGVRRDSVTATKPVPQGRNNLSGTSLPGTLNSKLSPRYAALYLLKAILINKIVEATITFRLFEGIGVVRGCGRAKLSEKRMHFVREKRDKPPGRRFHAGMRVAKSFVLSKVLKFDG